MMQGFFSWKNVARLCFCILFAPCSVAIGQFFCSLLASTPPKNSPTETTTSVPAVSTTSIYSDCQTATNLTESWRMDHNGTDIKPGGPNSFRGYACDLRHSLGWFRFTGSAGKVPSAELIIVKASDNVCMCELTVKDHCKVFGNCLRSTSISY